MAESFGVEDRGHFYDPVGALRDVVVNHMMQVRRRRRDGGAGRRRRGPLKDALFAVFSAMPEASPTHYVRGQYDGYRAIDGVAAGSTTETYAAMRLEIDNWRWAGVPWFLRTGKCLPVTQTELRIVFRRPPRLAFIAGSHRPRSPSQLVIKLDPLDRDPATRSTPSAADSGRARADHDGHGVRARRAERARPRTRCSCTPR